MLRKCCRQVSSRRLREPILVPLGAVTSRPLRQYRYSGVSTTPGQQQSVNGASVQSPWASRLANAPSTIAPHHSASATASTIKVAVPTTTIGSGLPVGAPGLHISASSTSINIQPPPASDPVSTPRYRTRVYCCSCIVPETSLIPTGRRTCGTA